ncbi:MAG: dihydroorotase [Chloroflexi bacterium]|nr:dihydroorotase [Chloroflexota bacterium]
MPERALLGKLRATGESPRPVIIRGGRVLDPGQNVDGLYDVLITGGKVKAVSPKGFLPETPGAIEIDASGLVACPGFIDLHCHLREPGYEDKETIASGTAAAARGGFTVVCCMPNTNPPIDRKAVVDLLAERAAADAQVSVLPFGTVTSGRSGAELSELGELAAAGVAGFSDDGSPVSDSRLMRNALLYSRMLALPVINHAEDLRLSEGGVMHEGAVASRLGLPGITAAAEEAMLARDIALARETGGRLHVPHVSTKASLELVRSAKAEGLPVTAEVTPHHLTLHEDWVAGHRRTVLHGEVVLEGPGGAPYDTNTKVNPPLRSREDLEALAGGVADGTIDAIATDHAPHMLIDKECEYGYAAFGISGLETALASLMSLVRCGLLDLRTVVERLTVGPARIAGIERGTLAVGSAADVVIFDPREEWVVDPSAFASKGKNTPLEGCRVFGKVVATLVGGEFRWQKEPF